MKKVVLSFVCVMAFIASTARVVKFKSDIWDEIRRKAKVDNFTQFHGQVVNGKESERREPPMVV